MATGNASAQDISLSADLLADQGCHFGRARLKVMLLQGLDFSVTREHRQLLQRQTVHIMEPGQSLAARIVHSHVEHPSIFCRPAEGLCQG